MDKNRITQSAIIAITTLIATASWEGLKIVLYQQNNWIWPALGFLVMSVFLSLTWLISESKTTLFITLAVINLSFLFVFGLRWEYWGAFVGAFLLMIFGSYRAIDEKRARLKIQVFKILKRGLPYVMTGLALIIATAYYFSPLALVGQNQLTIPRPLFDLTVKPILSNFEKNMPLNQIPGYYQQELSEQTSINDILYNTINQGINKHSQEYKEYFPLGLSLGIFFAVKTMSIFFIYLIILLSGAVFKILIHYQAIQIQEKSVLQQIIDV